MKFLVFFRPHCSMPLTFFAVVLLMTALCAVAAPAKVVKLIDNAPATPTGRAGSDHGSGLEVGVNGECGSDLLRNQLRRRVIKEER